LRNNPGNSLLRQNSPLASAGGDQALPMRAAVAVDASFAKYFRQDAECFNP
jgi:hypothetical protein